MNQNCFKMTVEYDGTDFVGWQIQARSRTVQGELARALTDRVNEINERVSGWAYRIQQNAFETMTKRQQDLLKPVDSTGT